MPTTRQAHRSGLIGVGYQGSDIERFVNGLLAEGVSLLVDVRLTPISRKTGFSKSALSQALASVGIGYQHRPELGNPKPNREGFAGGAEELIAARKTFAGRLRQPEARQALDLLVEEAQSRRVAVLCFEADQQRCHRDVVLGEAARLMGQRLG